MVTAAQTSSSATVVTSASSQEQSVTESTIVGTTQTNLLSFVVVRKTLVSPLIGGI